MSEVEGQVRFGEGRWGRTRGEDGFYCAGDPGWIPVRDLIGRPVNLGTKDGLVYESVVVTGSTVDGRLILQPGTGRMGWPWQPERDPEPVGAGETVPVTEIARGYIRRQTGEGHHA